MSRDWDHGKIVSTMAHPAPIVRALEVYASDARVPPAARSLRAVAGERGWDAKLSYALGTDVRADGAPGAVVSSVALWCRARGESGPSTAYAVWLTRARAVCPGCGGEFMPTDAGLFRAHGKPVACEGAGQAAQAKRVDDPGAVTRTAFWFGRWRGTARSLNATEFRAALLGELAADERRPVSVVPLAVEFRFAMAGLAVTVIDDH